ncbi:hypothetical protein [Polyangium sp. y55x31]|uniref:hypothetical protein n=1 Tax=Polyangium sp. y55x31 TaxID=3042688 RepID=UPI00248268EF|nr:hypothetical protein [Polyangium sp. y55x31]MDI1480410.1 hypothetical protein [Polyangium sp. y55x31]
MAIDLMTASDILRRDILNGRVACGINHVMKDYESKREKAFDLVFHRPVHHETARPATTFKNLLKVYGVVLTHEQQKVVDALPDIPVRDVKAHGVYIAFEAKAAMTEFGKARPRLFDELNSSHPTIHGDTDRAIAAGCVMINVADTFISPLRNPDGPHASTLEISAHKQPKSFEDVVDKIHELPLRSVHGKPGFDALGIIAVECRNDGTPVVLREAPDVLKDYEYDGMISRVAHLYESYFSH